MMVASYQRRQEWLAERQAVHVINLLGQAMGGKKGRRGNKSSGGPPRRVSASQMFGEAGKQI